MRRSFTLRVLWIVCLSLPAFADDSAYDQAIRKAARVSGYWEAKLDPAQSEIFAPQVISDITIEVGASIRRETAVAEMANWRMAFRESGVDWPARSGKQVITEDGFQLEGARLPIDRSQREIKVKATLSADAKELRATISYGDKSAMIVFTRPAPSPNAAFHGDWVSSQSTMGIIGVLHVYQLESSRIVATFDQVGTDQSTLGIWCSNFGSKIGQGVLSMVVQPSGVHSFDGTLEGRDRLKIQWRGSGSLSEPDYARLAPGSYPKAQVFEAR
jgi:hypothetical protein